MIPLEGFHKLHNSAELELAIILVVGDKNICYNRKYIQVIPGPHSHSLDIFIGQKVLGVGQTGVEHLLFFFLREKSMPLHLDVVRKLSLNICSNIKFAKKGNTNKHFHVHSFNV